MQTETRQLYRIKRGSFTRRDGAERPIVNGRGERTGFEKEHVTYSPKTVANMQAKDEVYMTDTEADKFGRHKLVRIFEQGALSPKKVEKKVEDVTPSTVIANLIASGKKAKTPKEKRDWRKEVIDADIIDDVPDRHADIMDALKEIA